MNLLSYGVVVVIVEDSCEEDVDLTCPWVKIKPIVSLLRPLIERERDYLFVLRQTQSFLGSLRIRDFVVDNLGVVLKDQLLQKEESLHEREDVDHDAEETALAALESTFPSKVEGYRWPKDVKFR